MVKRTKKILSEKESGQRELRVIYILLAIPILFLPGWAYRFILKSTLWLWWILLFAGGEVNLRDGIRGFEVDIMQKWWPRAMLVAAGIYIIGFMLVNFSTSLIANLVSDTPVLGVLVVLLKFDLSQLHLLSLLALLASIGTWGLWFWTDALKKDHSIGRDISAKMWWLGRAVQLRNCLGAATIALTMAYVGLYANTIQHWFTIADWEYAWLHRIYGEYAKVLRR